MLLDLVHRSTNLYIIYVITYFEPRILRIYEFHEFWCWRVATDFTDATEFSQSYVLTVNIQLCENSVASVKSVATVNI